MLPMLLQGRRSADSRSKSDRTAGLRAPPLRATRGTFCCPAPGLSCRQQKKGPAHIAGPPAFSSAEIYFVQVSLIIFTSVTLKLPIASLLDAFSTCPSFFFSTFVSGLAVPVTVT